LSRNNFAGSLPAGLGSLQQLTYLNVSGTSLACPLHASTCVVSQSSASPFCLQCPSFCSSCSSAAAEAASSAPGMGAAPTACQQFPLDVVTTTTGDWAECNLLGSGGFGEVYKGVSPLDGTSLWAVKRAKSITTDFRWARWRRSTTRIWCGCWGLQWAAM
ncbi:hypothetical protein CLOP_g10267, partial [Closterium sp. NIES-67]